MKQYFYYLIILLAFLLYSNKTYSQCEGTGAEIHDDGTFENSYALTSDSMRFIVKMQPSVYPWQYDYVCIGWTRESSGNSTLNYNIYVYDVVDSNGAPGERLFDFPGQVVTDIPVSPEIKWEATRIKVPYLLRKAYYVGIRYENNPQTGVFIAADESPASQIWPGYNDTLTDHYRSWLPNESVWSSYKCLAIRTLGQRANDNLSCVDLDGGSEIHDDGIYENCYTNSNDTGKFVIKMQPSMYPWKYTRVCIGFVKQFTELTNFLDYKIAVYKDNGVGGLPGDLVAIIPGQRVEGITNRPLVKWNYTDLDDLPNLESGAYYFGCIFSNPLADGIYIPADESEVTPLWPGYHWYNDSAWHTNEIEWDGYKCMAIRTEGYFDTLSAIIQIGTEIPESFTLAQNYPNPFNPSTKIKFAVPKESFVQVIIYDLLGREVNTIVNEKMKPGTYEVDFDGTDLPSGVYFYRLTVGDASASLNTGFSQTKKMVLLK